MHKVLDERGFTMAELLVSTVVTLMVLGAALGTFSDAIRVTDAARETTDTNQNLEVALRLMTRDFIQAGGHGLPLGGIPIPNGAGATAVKRPGPAGGDLSFPLTMQVLPAVTPGNAIGPTILGRQTDIVSIMYVDPTHDLSSDVLSAISNDGSSITFPASIPIDGSDGIKVGDLILMVNGNGKAIQMVSGIAGQTVHFAAGDEMNLNQRAAAEGSVMQLQTPAQDGDPASWPPTTAYRVTLVTYYIDVTTDPNLPRLVRQVNYGERLAVALGIENIQVSYDLVDGTTNPVNRDVILDPYSPHQIRKVNLFLAGRSIDVNPRTRQFYRNTVATQISLRSLAFVDRYNPEEGNE